VEKYKGSVLGRTHAKESFTNILFIRAIKPRPPEPLPLKLHARSLWFFICFRRPYAPCLYISPPLCLNRNCAYQGTSRAKVFRQNSIINHCVLYYRSPSNKALCLIPALSQCRRLAAVFQAAYARKHYCLSCKKGLCCPSSTTFCVGQTVVSTERLAGRYTRSKRERVLGEDFCPHQSASILQEKAPWVTRGGIG